MHGAFIHNFGPQPAWWTTVILGVATLTVIELVVQSIRRVYWPTDQDIMQRIEKEAYAEGRLVDRIVTVEHGLKGEETSSGLELTDDANTTGIRRGSALAGHDTYRPPNFTPPAEEKENPFEVLKNKIRSRGDSTSRA